MQKIDKKLNIFKSNFNIRADLANKELEIQSYWKKNILSRNLNKRKKNFIIHCGPPYANGNIHIGHALNIILKDFALRFQVLSGKNSQYLPGWDTHGLPIALEVTKRSKSAKTVGEFRNSCQKFALEQIQKQKKQFQRLGLLIDFDKNYLTLDKNYVSHQLEIFASFLTKKLLFYSLKPIYWSWSSKTALADTEVEYKEIITKSVFLKFPLKEKGCWTNSAFLVWTTTIWTIPENKFLVIAKKAEYCLIQTTINKEKLIVAKQLWEKLQVQIPHLQGKIIKTFKGDILVGKEYFHPYLEQTSEVVAGNYVHFQEGTGIVHAAPEFGLDDFILNQKIKKKIDNTIDENGNFNQRSSDTELIGFFYQKVIPLLQKKIANKGNLFAIMDWKHQYPHDWRTHKPVIYRATKQLYLNLKPLKKILIETVKKTNWIPNWGEKRLLKLLTTREDWCLSRQRNWGVPIPVFFDSQKKPILEAELVLKVAKLIKKYGDNIWWEWPLEKFFSKKLREKYQIAIKGQDTFDVWFDSGCSLVINMQEKNVDLIWEGNDQYRGWFNSLFIVNAALEKKWPIKTVLTHGFVNDLKGKKMSKSQGNIIDPNKICQTLGADVLRLWVASGNYFDDLNLGQSTFTFVSKNYLKIRNTLRFCINNLLDFDFQKHYQPKLTKIDQYLLKKLELVIAKIEIYFQKYKYHLVYLHLINFINAWLSNFYFDYGKNLLYTKKLDSLKRRQIQTTIWIILKKLTIVWAPILPHTTEEVFQTYYQEQKKSIHLSIWPKNSIIKDKQQEKLIYQWKFLLDLKNALNKFWEKKMAKREIKNSRNYQIIINVDKNYQLFLNQKEYQDFNEENKIIDADNWEKNNQLVNNFFLEFNNWDFLKDFYKVYKINFTKEKQKEKIEIGSINYQKNPSLLCIRCQRKAQIENKSFCQECADVLQN